MELIPYTYCLLRYVHDPAAGEIVNIGVVVYAPEVRYVSVRTELRYGAFSDLFAGFDGEHFKRVLMRFEADVQRIQNTLQQDQDRLIQAVKLPQDAAAICRYIWPDNDLSFQSGVALGGVTRDIRTVTDKIFHQLVTS